ncbi:Glycosyltransferase involved in cell wall bisynthesis [Novosphingobium sp. CF614]|uniref:glycosyltransferase family 4 protein n=1 Tax=Novosphingobium sp. CF614 TaxID=1884364 RepID=UPI0008DF5508|nr:glycosyltransferase [Novosphingobium sp. CF614]SFG20431.1 Glycosyltransferase involved in cell wall bisynthesis [Novosphingobium sp. CF614]
MSRVRPADSGASSSSAAAMADEQTLPQIVHVIPYDDIGGVETAASSVPAGRYPGFILRKAYVASKRQPEPRPYVYESGIGPENNPLAFARTIGHLLHLRPAALVLSLWRSCIVGLAVKALRPRTQLVIFLHNTRHANRVDALLTQLTARVSDAIWADSASTAAQRLGPTLASRARQISFLTARLGPVTSEQPAAQFITWGRLHPRKRIDLALEFFALVHAHRAEARFTIIGPDRGEQPMLEAKVAQLALTDAVRFVGPADQAEIARHAAAATFFVQTSRFEGMGMAVVEAMQLGLIPIVTPVGEIGKYVEDGRNGIWFSNPEQARHRVEQVLADVSAFCNMREASVRTWRDSPLYRDEFLAACAGLAASQGEAVR